MLFSLNLHLGFESANDTRIEKSLKKTISDIAYWIIQQTPPTRSFLFFGDVTLTSSH